MKEEIWKDVPGYEGKYRVSNLGRVQNTWTGNFLYMRGDKDGYIRAQLSLGESCKTKKIHRIVLETFNPIDGFENLTVNHKDLDKTNNRLENLEWATITENNRHARKKLGNWNPSGFDSVTSKMSKEDLSTIHKLGMIGLNNTDIARIVKVSEKMVRSLIMGDYYKKEFKERALEIRNYRETYVNNKKERIRYKKNIESGKYATDKDIEEIKSMYFDKFMNFDEIVSNTVFNKAFVDSVISSVPKDSPVRADRLKSGKAHQAGVKNGRRKLSPEEVLEILDRVKNGESKSSLSKEYKISRSVILKISNGKLWSSVTGIVYDE